MISVRFIISVLGLQLAMPVVAQTSPLPAEQNSAIALGAVAKSSEAQSSEAMSSQVGNTQEAKESLVSGETLQKICEDTLGQFKAQKQERESLKSACARVEVLDGCSSVKGVPIYHYDRSGNHGSKQKILVFSLIHGDEIPAGSVSRFWMERLSAIEPRNSWRVVPVLNPDGVKARTRTNANRIDLNRNFPTKDWEEKAKTYWRRDSKSNPRRNPGEIAGSEPEVKCALKHIEEFKPDMVVSIHTPLNVLDFDGPSIRPPKFEYLPWRSLGHYPGSLGRYMWHERKVPVLTMELKEDAPTSAKPMVELQDIIGFLVSMEFSQPKDAKSELQPPQRSSAGDKVKPASPEAGRAASAPTPKANQ